MTKAGQEVSIQPLVSWPRQVVPGGSYLVTVDLHLSDADSPWPYDEEELVVGCMLDGGHACKVRALGVAGVILHRFGGTYGPARFVADVSDNPGHLADAALWLTLTTAGGVPFYTGELPLDGKPRPARRPPLEAIMLVGGKGTRLRPLTLSAPKPLLPTAGVPFLAHQLARAAECGITHVVLATSYRAEMFTEAFGTGEAFGLLIDYVCESEPLGTGGGIRKAAGLLRGGPDDPIVVLNGDVLSGHDLPAQVDLHRKKEAAVTLQLVPVDDPSRYGCVPTDASGRVTAFLEKTPDPVTNQINAGCYVFRRSVIDTIPDGQVVSVERETFPGLIQAGAVVMGYAENAYWLDVGTLEAFVRGSCDLVRGILPSSALPGPPGESLVLDGAIVAAEARLSGGTVIGRGSTVSAGAVVQGSIIFDVATIGTGAIIRNSIVGRGATVAAGAMLTGVTIGDSAYIGSGNELALGLLIWPDVRLEPNTVRFSSDS